MSWPSVCSRPAVGRLSWSCQDGRIIIASYEQLTQCDREAWGVVMFSRLSLTKFMGFHVTLWLETVSHSRSGTSPRWAGICPVKIDERPWECGISPTVPSFSVVGIEAYARNKDSSALRRL